MTALDAAHDRARLPSAVPSNAAAPSLPRAPLIDASALAVELGVSRAFVYEHAAELGAMRLGSGPKARLRFDPVAAREALCRYGSGQSHGSIASTEAKSEQTRTPRARRVPRRMPQPGSILAVRPRGA